MPLSAQALRAQAALEAMKLVGFDPGTAKAVLKKLLKVYENNWEYIEAENYRLLADSILDDQESKGSRANDSDATVCNEEVLCLKRLRDKKDAFGSSPLAIESDGSRGTVMKRSRMISSAENPSPNQSGKTVEAGSVLINGKSGEMVPWQTCSYEEPSCTSGHMVPGMTRPLSSTVHGEFLEQSRSNLRLTYHKVKQQVCGWSGSAICNKEPKIELDSNAQLDIVGVGSFTFPVKMKHEKVIFIVLNDLVGPTDAYIQAGQNNEVDVEGEVLAKKHKASERFSTTIDISSSPMGEVKLSMTYSSGSPHFKVPSLGSLLKKVEDRCLKSYKIIQPNFSLMKLMKELCQCAVDLAAESQKDPKEVVLEASPLLEQVMKRSQSSLHHGLNGRSYGGSLDLVVSEIPRTGMTALESIQNTDGNNYLLENRATKSSCLSESQSWAIFPLQEYRVSVPRPPHDENDISKGEERVKISVVNEFNRERAPPYFHYVSQNVVFQNAHVNFSLARIGDEDCCVNCFGNCLNAPIPCACTRETGGEFVYTMDGLLKKEFLHECVSMHYHPDEHPHVYCKYCPIEKSKNQLMAGKCKGHLVRKFIKECWRKCGCNKLCGNRVVQRGITRNLQVFYASVGKGWGLRTLEELPRGAFVCEYVGEILTNIELYDRTIQKTGSAKHTYPVLLDADWGSEAILRDEEALCLDATFFGNVGRFVNHRCCDANLIEIPVEWETPDHHYYHLAFFTTRKVEALEELTWDYCIDFEDQNHPVKAFKCLCGSSFCRDSATSKPYGWTYRKEWTVTDGRVCGDVVYEVRSQASGSN